VTGTTCRFATELQSPVTSVTPALAHLCDIVAIERVTLESVGTFATIRLSDKPGSGRESRAIISPKKPFNDRPRQPALAEGQRYI